MGSPLSRVGCASFTFAGSDLCVVAIILMPAVFLARAEEEAPADSKRRPKKRTQQRLVYLGEFVN